MATIMVKTIFINGFLNGIGCKRYSSKINKNKEGFGTMAEKCKKEYEAVTCSLTFFTVDVICTSGDGVNATFQDGYDYGLKDFY